MVLGKRGLVGAAERGLRQPDRTFNRGKSNRMIEMEFIGGPWDGTQEVKAEAVPPTLRVPAHLYGYYQLCKRENEEERPLTTLHLSEEELRERYRYLWIPKDSRGKAA